MKKAKLFIPLVCAVLAAVLLFPTFGALAASAELGEYDYTSSDRDAEKATLSEADLLESYLGTSLHTAEYDYLQKYGEITLSYDNFDNSKAFKSVLLDLDEESGLLTVRAKEYSYAAMNGTTVVWHPVAATVDGARREFEFVVDAYTATLEGAELSGLAVELEYYTEITFGAEDIDRMLFRASGDIPALLEKRAELDAEYEALLADYERRLSEYNDYVDACLEYEAKRAEYNLYLAAKARYDEEYSEYLEYLDDLEEYTVAKELYDAYLLDMDKYNAEQEKYLAYLRACENYEADLLAYEQYLANMELLSDQLAMLDAVEAPMTDDRTVYSAIQSGLVDTVLENQGVLVEKYGANPDAIAMAGRVTPILREMLSHYVGLGTDEEKYTYYVENHSELAGNLSDLARALLKLYTQKMKGYIKAAEKDRKYEILVAQLIIISNALNGAPISNFDGTGTLGNGTYVGDRTVNEILENRIAEYITPVDPEPLEGGYPVKLTEPVLPTPVDKPVMPTTVNEPVMPDKVTEPTPPTPVDEPEAPTDVREHPGDVPEKLYMEPEQEALVSAYERGELASLDEREECSEDTALRIYSRAVRYYDESIVSVTFHVNGVTHSVQVVKGAERAKYAFEQPTREADERGTYIFRGWVDADGNSFSLNNYVYENVELWPDFLLKPRSYDINFVVDGTVHTVPTLYGSVPSLGSVPSKADDSFFEYTFERWDAEPIPVSGEATYTAVFSATPILSVGGEAAEIAYSDGYIVADLLRWDPTPVDISGLVERAASRAANGQPMGILLHFDGATLRIPFTSAEQMAEQGISELDPSFFEDASLGSYRVDAYTADGGEYTEGLALEVSLETLHDGAAPFFLRRLSEEGAQGVKFTIVDGILDFKLVTGADYRLAEEYTLNIMAPEGVTVTVGGISAVQGENVMLGMAPGERVSLLVEAAPGYRVSRIYYTDASGVEHSLSEQSFIMPEGHISLGVESLHEKYTIRFINGDRLIVSYEQYYGDPMPRPADRSSVVEGDIRYIFDGWQTENGVRLENGATVTGDATYYACFRTEYYEAPVYDSFIDPRLLPYYVALEVCTWMIYLVILPCLALTAVFIVVKVKRRRR